MFQSPFDQPEYRSKPKPKKKKKKKKKKAAKAKPRKKVTKKKVTKKATRAPRPGFPHENIRAGQHWSFVYHGQYGYLITHGKVVSKRGERCHVKPARGAASAWVQASPYGEKPPSISRAGAMVECHSPGDLVQSRLVEPYTSKAQFKRLADRLAKVYKRVTREKAKATKKRTTAKTAWGADLSLCKKCDTYKLKGKKCEVCASRSQTMTCPRGWHMEGNVCVHQDHQVGVAPREEPSSGIKQFAIVYRNTSGRGKSKWISHKGFSTAKKAFTEARLLIKRRARLAIPRPETIVVTPKQLDAMLKKGKDWIKHRSVDYWPVLLSRDQVSALVGTKKQAGARKVRFVRADSELDPRYGRGPGYVPAGPWSKAKKNPIPEAGDRIELVHMDDPYPIAPGTQGTVRNVQLVSLGGGMLGGTATGGFFQVGVDWDNGRSLMLSIPPDRIRIVRQGPRSNPRLRRGGNPPAELNDHGAFFMVGKEGSLAGTFATVNGAADSVVAMHPGIRQDPLLWAGFKNLLAGLRQEPPGTVDCFYNAWPIVWFDPNRDECQSEVDDWEAYEEAMTLAGKDV
jgi:hypothetical protein